MSTKEKSGCEQSHLIPDYAFDELAPAERRGVEQHLRQCAACANELDQLRLTTAALRVLPDQEVPRRIAFVSDSPVGAAGWLSGFWNSAARLGFASACVLAAGLSFAAWHRQPVVAAPVATVSDATIQQAVDKAVAVAVDKAHAQDIQMTKAALDAVDSKYALKQRDLMVAMQETMAEVGKKLALSKVYAMTSYDTPRMEAGQ
jgi:anti-sigma factor RsiW